MHRRDFLTASARTLALAALLPAASCSSMRRGGGGSVDRRAVVDRHSPRVRSVDETATLSVGNGRFAFTVDATGLQFRCAQGDTAYKSNGMSLVR